MQWYYYPNYRVLETEVCKNLVIQHFKRHQLLKSIFLFPSLEIICFYIIIFKVKYILKSLFSVIIENNENYFLYFKHK